MGHRHLPRFLTGFAAGCLAVAAAAWPAPAAAAPDVRGTWKLHGAAIVAGAGAHHPADAPPPAEGGKPRLRTSEITLRVTGQEGARFWGTVASRSYQEDLIGIFTGEGGRFSYVDTDGVLEGTLGEDGTIRYCYRQNAPALRVISCGTGRRE